MFCLRSRWEWTVKVPIQLCAEFCEEWTILPFMWDALLALSLSSVDAVLQFLLLPNNLSGEISMKNHNADFFFPSYFYFKTHNINLVIYKEQASMCWVGKWSSPLVFGFWMLHGVNTMLFIVPVVRGQGLDFNSLLVVLQNSFSKSFVRK